MPLWRLRFSAFKVGRKLYRPLEIGLILIDRKRYFNGYFRVMKRTSPSRHLSLTSARPKAILLYCGGGIGNRIKGLASARRLARTLSTELLVYWPKDALTGAEYSDLFEAPLPTLSAPEFEGLYEKQDPAHLFLGMWRLHLLNSDEAPASQLVSPAWSGRSIDFEFGRIPERTRQVFRRELGEIQPRAEIREEAQAFRAENFPAPYVAISVRSYPERPDLKRAFFNYAETLKAVETHGQRPFFLSCDDPALLQTLRAASRGNAIVFPKKTFQNDRTSRTGQRDILVDALILAGAQTLVASNSTFSEIAWWWGGARAEFHRIPTKSRYFDACDGHVCLFRRWYPTVAPNASDLLLRLINERHSPK